MGAFPHPNVILSRDANCIVSKVRKLKRVFWKFPPRESITLDRNANYIVVSIEYLKQCYSEPSAQTTLWQQWPPQGEEYWIVMTLQGVTSDRTQEILDDSNTDQPDIKLYQVPPRLVQVPVAEVVSTSVAEVTSNIEVASKPSSLDNERPRSSMVGTFAENVYHVESADSFTER